MANTLASSPVYVPNVARLAPNFFRANPNAAFAQVLGNGSYSHYHALQVEVRRRFARGLLVQSNYTFSKAITDSEGTLNSADTESYYTLRNLRLDRHRANYDLTHTFASNFIYELPFGTKRRFLNGGPTLLRKAFEGWQVQGIVNVHSGPPVWPVSNRLTFNQFKTAGFNAPNLLMSFEEYKRNTGLYKTPQGVFYFNPQLLNITTDANGALQNAPLKDGILAAPAPGTFGNFPRNALNGQTFVNVDAGVLKRTYFSERGNVEFRAEFFNLFNRANFATPSLTFDTSRYAQITGLFGGPRIGQLAMRVNW